MENGGPPAQDVSSDLPEKEKGPTALLDSVTHAASTHDGQQKNGVGSGASDVTVDLPSRLPSSAGKDKKLACLTKAHNGKPDLKVKAPRSMNTGVASSPRASEAATGTPVTKTPKGNVKASGSVSKSIGKEKGLLSSLDATPTNSSPSVGKPRCVRSSHSNFTVPQPFTLATDKRASLGGQSSEPHPFGRSRSFQASRKDDNKHLGDKIDSPRLVDKHGTEKVQATMQLRAGANSFNFNSDVRAERRREFNSKLEERLNAKEVASKQAQAKTKEEIDAEIKEFRKSLSFKATPMPVFYQEPTPPKMDIKKIPPTRPKSPRLGRKGNSTGVSSDAKSESLGCTLDDEQSLLDNNHPSEVREKKAHVPKPVLKEVTIKGSMSPAKKSSKFVKDEDGFLTEQQVTRNDHIFNGKVSGNNSPPNQGEIMPEEASESLQAAVNLNVGEHEGSFSNANDSKDLHRKENDVNPAKYAKCTTNVAKPKLTKVNLHSSVSKAVAHQEAKEHRAFSAKKKQTSTSNGGNSKNAQTGKATIKNATAGNQELSPVSSIVADVTVAS